MMFINEAANSLPPELMAGDDDITRWALRIGVVSLFGYIWRNERKQTLQDIAIKDLELDIERNRPHKDDFEELKRSVQNIDRLVRRIAVKQGISTREDD